MVHHSLTRPPQHVQLVLVDDGSTDDSATIAARYAAEHDHVQLHVHDENRGIVAALQTALVHAKGDLLARMDADDVSLPERLETQVAFLREREDVGVVGTAVTVFYDDERVQDKVIVHPGGVGMVAWSMFFFCALAHPTVMLRRHVLQDESYDSRVPSCEDYDLWHRLLRRGVRMANVSEPLLRLRKHGANVSTKRKEQQQQSHAQVVHEALVAALDDETLSPDLAKHLASPAHAEPSTQLELFHLIGKLEAVLLKNDSFSEADKEAITKDAIARQGEVMALLLQADPMSAATLMPVYLARAPPGAMASLFA